ncbi:repressor of yield of DENV protein homolog [Acanthaster planci]|uniref:Repressor of yield of DENV protein homolog n=1 Tax=Acanthaster planci TaxID=133434 RepID=A0A8B7ZFM4_ACAPL|nr:repressor of yield of DENV protein homolog [Acanthaster planci]
MGDDMERTFYIPHERLLEKHATIPEDVKRKRFEAICKAITRESGNAVNVQYEIQDNRTIRFTIQGTMDQIGIAIGLLERHLTKERCQDRRALPQNVAPLTVDNLRQHNHTMMEQREFACQACQNVWWRKVFSYKPVSRCNRCHVRYDAVPRDRVFGWGKFRCHCGNVFFGRAQAGVPSICFQCRASVLPDVDSIGPMQHNGPRQYTRNRHACDLCNNGRIQPCPGYNRVLCPSLPHISTGSTASTFLTQQSHAYNDPLN